MVTAPRPLIEWDRADAATLWAGRLLNNTDRWLEDGYYYVQPEGYTPAGKNYFYRLSAAYMATAMAWPCADPAAKYLSLPMIDKMISYQTEEGYFPTTSESDWLQTDYGIGTGFYDTRFNTDFATGLVAAYQTYGMAECRAAMRRYLDFFEAHAARNHIAFAGDAGEGWMVSEYWNPNGGKQTHASLNHQASELLLLQRARDVMQLDHTELSDKMLRGIENSESIWVKADGNLEYGVMPDGTTMMGEDYPELTYNDLYDLQDYLEKHGTPRSQPIRRLMISKREWMIHNKVTGYRQ